MISPHALQLWELPISKCVDMLTCSSRKGRNFPTEALLLGHIINDSKPTEPGIGGALMSKHRSTWFDFHCDNMGNCQHPLLKSSQRDLTQNMNTSALRDISFREQGSWDPFLWTLLLLQLWGGRLKLEASAKPTDLWVKTWLSFPYAAFSSKNFMPVSRA